ncbi:molecular chaperone [Solibacillus sp. FSL H8-0523]|uniref:molecular chaperone n=1 Tax=Solibacillus sp. FSL H8-0523 TaxID=2954511 RepID=UPI003100AE10
MKLVFLKIDRIVETADTKFIEIPAGGIQFEMRGQAIQSMEPVAIEMAHDGMFKNIIRNINFAVYTDQSLNASGQVMHESMFSVVAHEDVQRAIHKELAKRCKVVPMFRPIDTNELFCREFERAYEDLVGV